MGGKINDEQCRKKYDEYLWKKNLTILNIKLI